MNATRRFRAAVRELNAALADLRKQHPDANYYLVPGVLHLMKGESHGGSNCTPQRGNILASEQMPRAGGGDW